MITIKCYVEMDEPAGSFITIEGRLKDNESPEDAAKRIVFEKAGLKLRGCEFRGLISIKADDEVNEVFVFTAGLSHINGLFGGSRFFRVSLGSSEGKGCSPDILYRKCPVLFQSENALGYLRSYMDPGIRKVLIVTGKNSAKANGSLKDVTYELEKFPKIEYSIFDGIEENPSVESVMAAAYMGREAGVDAVIGIGGGSPLDAAKAAALMIKNRDKGIDYLYEKGNPSEYIPVICIPTTCGTGSEATGVSVLSRPESFFKGSIPYRIYPSIGLMDSKYLEKAPDSLIINTALDALAHMCESYINTATTPLTRAYVMQGLAEWSGALGALKGERELTDADRDRLLLASTLAGMAIAIAGTSVPHALSYALTMKENVPHGPAVSYFLPAFLRGAGEDGEKLVKAAGFSGNIELEELVGKACGRYNISENTVMESVDSLMHNEAKLATCPYIVTKELYC